MSTYRERRQRKAERLAEWAEKRDAKADAAFAQSKAISDMIPFGQPILVGHHSEKRHRADAEKITRGMEKGIEHSRKAEDFRSRAEGIEHQLDTSIYSDDPDAAERLAEKIAGLEAERDRIKAFNASVRKGTADYELLDERQRALLLSIAQVAPYQLGKGGAFPGYALTNLGGNISRLRKRLAGMEGQ